MVKFGMLIRFPVHKDVFSHVLLGVYELSQGRVLQIYFFEAIIMHAERHLPPPYFSLLLLSLFERR